MKELSKSEIGGVILLMIVGVFIFIRIFSDVTPNSLQCSEKSVTEIQVIPQSNFWGKTINYIVKYDDGSLTEYDDIVPSKKVGDKVCSY